MPTIAAPIAALVLALAQPVATSGECDRATMTPQTRATGQLTRENACWSPDDQVWFHNITLDVSRDSTVWILIAASGEASLLLGDGGSVLATANTGVERNLLMPDGMEHHLRRGRYVLQVRSRTAGTRYSVRAYWGPSEETAVGGCSRSSSGPLTVGRDSVASVETLSGCFDLDGRPAVIRRFRLDSVADVTVAARAQDGRTLSSVTLAGPGLEGISGPPMAISPAPGGVARITQHLGPGTYYAVFAAESRAATLDIGVVTAEPATRAALPDAYHPGCNDVSQAQVLPLGVVTAGRLTMRASCNIPGSKGDYQAWADFYRLTVPQDDTLDFIVQAGVFSPVLGLARYDDGTMLGQVADTTSAAVRSVQAVAAGEYIVLVAHARPMELGSYVLLVRRYEGGKGGEGGNGGEGGR